MTWTGSVYCQSNIGVLASKVGYIVGGQIQRGKSREIVQNSEGVNSLGRVAPVYRESVFDTAQFEDLCPVTLTGTFTVEDGDDDRYFARFDVETRNQSAFYNVNGGAMTALAMP